MCLLVKGLSFDRVDENFNGTHKLNNIIYIILKQEKKFLSLIKTIEPCITKVTDNLCKTYKN